MAQKISKKLKKDHLKVQVENLKKVLEETSRQNNVKSVSYKERYSYTLCDGSITRPLIGYNVVVEYLQV